MTKKVGIILGGTRGIGRALVTALARQWGDDGQVYLTARNSKDGEQVVSDLAVKGLNVAYLLFDLADPASPERLAVDIRQQHDGINLLVQNGAVMPRPDVSAAQDARPMIAANSHGTLRVLRTFAPLMRANGHISIIASGFGVLSSLPDQLANLFRNAGDDPDAINAIMDAYVNAAEKGEDIAAGWPAWANIPSKVGQVAVTRAFARSGRENGLLAPGVLITSANPGVTRTEATEGFMDTVFKDSYVQTPEEAALGLMKGLSLSPDAPVHGEMLEHGQVVPFDGRSDQS
jgi:carbonyl reductase 1